MTWKLGKQEFQSRILLGTAMYPDLAKLEASIIASETQICTVAIRRVDPQGQSGIFPLLKEKGITLLPNTAACYTAEEAILTAELAREALGSNLIKLEVIADPYTLLPEPKALLKACKILIEKGFDVLPYALDDLELCLELANLGCVAVMPLGSPIGSGQGIRNPHVIEKIVQSVNIPVIVDAGLGAASDCSLAMELGCEAVLMNTAIAKAENPALMAHAIKLSLDAGRASYLAGRIPKKAMASPSSPSRGKIELYKR